jgi:hypothetical protein
LAEEKAVLPPIRVSKTRKTLSHVFCSFEAGLRDLKIERGRYGRRSLKPRKIERRGGLLLPPYASKRSGRGY